jgi:hypothetical protein
MIFNFKNLKQVKTSKYEYPHKIHKVPVKTRLLNHQVMSPAIEVSSPGHDQHNDINDDPGENVESMETCYCKKEISKIG